MKTTDAITMITFLLVAITASDVVSGEKEVVLDTEGNPVKADKPYFISLSNSSDVRVHISRYNSYRPQEASAIETTHFIIHRGKQTPNPILFPDTVAFAADTLDPVIFMLRSNSDVVRVSTELSIRFKRHNEYSSGVWRVEESLPLKRVIVNQSWSLDEATFTIQKLKGGYRFAFGSADKPVTICAQVIGMSPVATLRLSNVPYIVATHPSLQVNMSCFPPVEFVAAWIRE